MLTFYIIGCLINLAQIIITFPQWEKAMWQALEQRPESYLYDFRLLYVVLFLICIASSWYYVCCNIMDIYENGHLY